MIAMDGDISHHIAEPEVQEGKMRLVLGCPLVLAGAGTSERALAMLEVREVTGLREHVAALLGSHSFPLSLPCSCLLTKPEQAEGLGD